METVKPTRQVRRYNQQRETAGAVQLEIPCSSGVPISGARRAETYPKCPVRWCRFPFPHTVKVAATSLVRGSEDTSAGTKREAGTFEGGRRNRGRAGWNGLQVRESYRCRTHNGRGNPWRAMGVGLKGPTASSTRHTCATHAHQKASVFEEEARKWRASIRRSSLCFAQMDVKAKEK
jgi:hypothetical protein